MDRRTLAFATGLTLALFVGCVPLSKHKKAMDASYVHGFAMAENECFELQKRLKDAFEAMGAEREALRTELELKNERLRTFNQINEDGTLKTSKKKK